MAKAPMMGLVEPLPPSTARRYLREEQRSMGRKCALINAVRFPAEGVDLITYSVQATDTMHGQRMFQVRWSLRTRRGRSGSRASGIAFSEIK